MQNGKPKGGKRINAGRKKGTIGQDTIDRNAIKEASKNRLAKLAEELISSQYSLAKGVQYLYRVDEVEKKNAQGKTYKTKVHVLVTDQEEIKNALDEGLTNGEDYYYITTEKPDGFIADKMLDRVFGKASQDINIKSKKPLTKVTVEIIDTNGKRRIQDSGNERIFKDN